MRKLEFLPSRMVVFDSVFFGREIELKNKAYRLSGRHKTVKIFRRVAETMLPTLIIAEIQQCIAQQLMISLARIWGSNFMWMVIPPDQVWCVLDARSGSPARSSKIDYRIAEICADSSISMISRFFSPPLAHARSILDRWILAIFCYLSIICHTKTRQHWN